MRFIVLPLPVGFEAIWAYVWSELQRQEAGEHEEFVCMRPTVAISYYVGCHFRKRWERDSPQASDMVHDFTATIKFAVISVEGSAVGMLPILLSWHAMVRWEVVQGERARAGERECVCVRLFVLFTCKVTHCLGVSVCISRSSRCIDIDKKNIDKYSKM